MVLGLGLLSAVIAVMLAFPDTDIGRGLKGWLVEAPARRLNRIQRGKAAFYALLAVIGFILVGLFEAEGMRLFGFMLPDTLVWFAMFDVGVFIDALLITSAILASNGLKAARAQASALPRVTGAVIVLLSARVRQPRRTRPGPADNSAADEDGPSWGQPAYRDFSMA